MSIAININHPTWLLKDNIQTITQPFLQQFGFNYFQYLRCFNDGSIGLLTNNTGLTEHFQTLDNTPVVYSSFTSEHSQQGAYWFLWDEALPAHPVSIVREKFSVCSGLTYVRRAPTYYDMIAVALPSPHAQPGGFYLNKLKAIESFVYDFDKQHQVLIKLMNKHPIALAPHARDVNYEKICLPQGKIFVQGKNGPTYITAQELACLRLLSSGFAYKEIAHQLNISTRTVETYLQRIKLRTHFSTTRELLRLLLACP